MSKTIRHTLSYLPAQTIAPTIQFISIIAWTHLLKPADLGSVTLVVSLQEVCFAAFVSWWSFYVLRFIASHSAQQERVRFLKTEIVALVAAITAQTVIVGIFFGFFFPLERTDLILAAGFMITRSLNNYMSERARANANILLYTLMQTAGPVIGFGIGIVLLLRNGTGAASVFTGFIIAQTLCFLLGFVMCDFGRSFGRPDWVILKKAAEFGGAVMTASMLAIVAINTPRFIVGEYLGIASVGIFAAGYGLGIRASSFAVMMVTAGSYPLVVRKMVEEGRAAAYRQLSTNMILVALVVFPVAFGLLAVNRSVIDVLIASNYRDAAYLVLPLSTMGGLFRYLRAHTTDQVFLINVVPKVSTWIAVLDLIVAVISTIIGVKSWGLMGAALGPMISGACTLVLSFVASQIGYGFIPPHSVLVKVGLAAAIMGVIVAVTPETHSITFLAIKVVAGAFLYCGLVSLLLPKERRIVFGAIYQLWKA